MNLDPVLAAVATAAIAPTKLLVDFVSIGKDHLSPSQKLIVGFLTALALISLYQGYTGVFQTAPSYVQLVCGEILAAFSTLTGAVLLTETQKRVARKKVERDLSKS